MQKEFYFYFSKITLTTYFITSSILKELKEIITRTTQKNRVYFSKPNKQDSSVHNFPSNFLINLVDLQKRDLQQKKNPGENFLKIKTQKILGLFVTTFPLNIIINTDYIYTISLSFFNFIKNQSCAFFNDTVIWYSVISTGLLLIGKKKLIYGLKPNLSWEKFSKKTKKKRNTFKIEEIQVFLGLHEENINLRKKKTFNNLKKPEKKISMVLKHKEYIRKSKAKFEKKGFFFPNKNKNPLKNDKYDPLGYFFRYIYWEKEKNLIECTVSTSNYIRLQTKLETNWAFGESIVLKLAKISEFFFLNFSSLFKNEILYFVNLFYKVFFKGFYKNVPFSLPVSQYQKIKFSAIATFSLIEVFQIKKEFKRERDLYKNYFRIFLQKIPSLFWKEFQKNLYTFLVRPFSNLFPFLLKFLDKYKEYPSCLGILFEKRVLQFDFKKDWKFSNWEIVNNYKNDRQKLLYSNCSIYQFYLKEIFLEIYIYKKPFFIVRNIYFFQKIVCYKKSVRLNPLLTNILLRFLFKTKNKVLSSFIYLFFLSTLNNCENNIQKKGHINFFMESLKKNRGKGWSKITFLKKFFQNLYRKTQKIRLHVDFVLISRTFFRFRFSSILSGKNDRVDQVVYFFYHLFKIIFRENRIKNNNQQNKNSRTEKLEKVKVKEIGEIIQVVFNLRKNKNLFAKVNSGFISKNSIFYIMIFLKNLNNTILNSPFIRIESRNTSFKKKINCFIELQTNGKNFGFTKPLRMGGRKIKKVMKHNNLLVLQERGSFYKIFFTPEHITTNLIPTLARIRRDTPLDSTLNFFLKKTYR